MKRTLRLAQALLRADALLAFRWITPDTAELLATMPGRLPVAKISLPRERIAQAGGLVLEMERPRALLSTALLAALDGEPSAVLVVCGDADSPRGEAAGGVLVLWHAPARPPADLLESPAHFRTALLDSLRPEPDDLVEEYAHARLRSVMDTVPQGVVFVDNSTGSGHVNRPAAVLLQVQAGDVEPTELSRAMHRLRRRTRSPEAFEARASALFGVPDFEVADWVWELTAPEPRVLSVASRPVRGTRVSGRVWVFDDVTERTCAAAALRASETRFRAVFDGAGMGIAVADLQGRPVQSNAALQAMLGYTGEELAGMSLGQITHPEDLATDWELFGELFAGERSAYQIEKRYHRKDGGLLWGRLTVTLLRDDEGEPRFALRMLEDITSRKAAEEAVHAATERFRAMIDNSSDLISIVGEDGALLYNSPSIRHLLGYEPEDLEGRGFLELIHPEDRPSAGRAFASMAGSPGVSSTYRLRCLHRDGSYRVIEGIGNNLLDHPAVGGVVVNSRDVTGWVELQQRLEARSAEALTAQRAAEQASRAKSEFLANMSHELRTPLNSIIGFSGVLRKNKTGDLRPQELTYLERIESNGRHLLELINDILDLSKIEAGRNAVELAPVDLGALVRDTLGALQGSARPGVELRVELPSPLGPVQSDERKLKQIVINLVGNALKFTEAGTVTVSLAADPATRRPVRLDVCDTGVGIPAERLEAIFEAFEQAESSTSRRFGGTGLGLAISSSLARQLGCEIRVRSEPGRGSTFSLLLGKRVPQEAEPARVPSAAVGT